MVGKPLRPRDRKRVEQAIFFRNLLETEGQWQKKVREKYARRIKWLRRKKYSREETRGTAFLPFLARHALLKVLRSDGIFGKKRGRIMGIVLDYCEERNKRFVSFVFEPMKKGDLIKKMRKERAECEKRVLSRFVSEAGLSKKEASSLMADWERLYYVLLLAVVRKDITGLPPIDPKPSDA